MSRQHLVQHSTERKNIASAIQVFSFHLLRRHVLEGSDNGSLLRHRNLLSGRQSSQAARRNRWLGQTKIQKLRAGFRQHDVSWLQIAVNYSLAVSFVQGIG